LRQKFVGNDKKYVSNQTLPTYY